MKLLTIDDILVPLDVPSEYKDEYINNYLKITQKTGRLMLFAGDQKIEHLNDDFYGPYISYDDRHPEHLFNIASMSNIGVFATQLGLISRYGNLYRDIPYLVKLNSKTNLIPTKINDPYSSILWNIHQIIEFKQNTGLNILGVGYTIYLGSKYESKMLSKAAQIVYEAHQYGLIATLWIYPRGISIKNEKDSHLIAGSTGVATCLGADFVKVNYPIIKNINSKNELKESILAAGNTKVIFSGGSSLKPELFLAQLYDQIHTYGAYGNATGRNIHQKDLKDAVSMCNAISAITIKDKSVLEAIKIYNNH